LLKEMKKDIEALEFIEKEGFGESVEYFVTILKSARPQFVKPCIRALEGLTGEKFKGIFDDIEAAREKAWRQYKALAR